MTKAQRERVKRAAAVLAIAPPKREPDPEALRLQGLRLWRFGEASVPGCPSLNPGVKFP